MSVIDIDRAGYSDTCLVCLPFVCILGYCCCCKSYFENEEVPQSSLIYEPPTEIHVPHRCAGFKYTSPMPMPGVPSSGLSGENYGQPAYGGIYF